MFCAAQAGAAERYVTLSVIGGAQMNYFDGINTAGAFSNQDSQISHPVGGEISYGLLDAFTFAGRPATLQFDLNVMAPQTLVSASFPGIPSPTFFYTSQLTSARVGASVWQTLQSDAKAKTEFGFGAGAFYRSLSTADTVVTGDGNGVAPYGQVGVRRTWQISKTNSLVAAVTYTMSDNINILLTNGTNGNMTLRTGGVEASVGYRIMLGKK